MHFLQGEIVNYTKTIFTVVPCLIQSLVLSLKCKIVCFFHFGYKEKDKLQKENHLRLLPITRNLFYNIFFIYSVSQNNACTL